MTRTGLRSSVSLLFLLAFPAPIVAPQEAPAPADVSLPEGALFRIGTPRILGDVPLQRLAVSPDGRLVATADVDGNVVVWDRETAARRSAFAQLLRILASQRDNGVPFR